MLDSLLPLFERYFGGRTINYEIPDDAVRTITKREVPGGHWIKEEYKAPGFEKVIEYFEANVNKIEVEKLEIELSKAINEQDFEKAAEIRDLLNMNTNEEYTYPGYQDSQAEEFFKGKIIKEESNTNTAVGTFIILSNGKTHLPSKGDVFIKDSKGNITLKC